MTSLIVALHAVAGSRPHPSDQEVERDQHQVEERDEQREILREERAEHRRLGEHEVEVEEPRALPRAAGSPRATAAANSSVVRPTRNTFSPVIASL